MFALASALGEFAGGLLFALGLITPIAAFVLVAQSVVIIGAAHWRKGFFNRDGGFEFPLALLIVVVAILIAGPGAYSLDAVLGFALAWSALNALAQIVAGGASLLVLRARGLDQDPRPVTQRSSDADPLHL